MALLNILQFPDPRLKSVAPPLTQFDQTVKQLINDMLETLYEAQGIGLAATQVNVNQHVIVIDVSSQQDQPRHFINLTILNSHGSVPSQEGCLSFPGVYATVERFQTIHVQFQDQNGQLQELHADGLLSICLQHELDHLKGITFYDHLSPLKKSLLKKKLAKIRKRAL